MGPLSRVKGVPVAKLPEIVIVAHRAAFPERSCRDHVWGEWQGYNCELPDLHKGPCVSWSVRASLQRRYWWEQAVPAGEEPTP